MSKNLYIYSKFCVFFFFKSVANYRTLKAWAISIIFFQKGLERSLKRKCGNYKKVCVNVVIWPAGPPHANNLNKK